MDFRIADTFTDSLAHLSGDEQKAVKTTAFDLQMDPSSPGMQFHKLDKAKDKNFWSVRVSSDIRLIVHKTESSLLLCYVDHHDAAYRWAERRKIEVHPKTGAAQLVEIRKTVQEIIVPKYVDVEQPSPSKPRLFAKVDKETLLRYGVPEEWLEDVLNANEDSLLELAGHLPAEAAEALLNLATGVTPPEPQPLATGADPFEHPDAQRRFRVMHNSEELKRAFEFPWEKWIIFLHPAQQQLIERDYKGPARVAGSAGTGKTIVALHRAVSLARNNPDARVVLTTFSDILANALRTRLRRLVSTEPKLLERVEVEALDSIGRRLYQTNISPLNLASKQDVRECIEEAITQIDPQKFSLHFLYEEWDQVVDAWQLDSWEAYRDVVRLGRKTRLREQQRQILWSIFEKVRAALKGKGVITQSEMFSQLAARFQSGKHPPFDFVVVDEAQDINVTQLRFLAAVGTQHVDALFFAGDLGQRIFQQPFSWKALGVDVRGRSQTLRVNYRTSHQIRTYADRLLAPELCDVDGNTEERRGTQSVFNGPDPEIQPLETQEEEREAVAKWITERVEEGVKPHEFGVFVRSADELKRASAAVEKAGLQFKILDEHVETASDHVSIATMHLAKGLEFRAVVVMACEDEIIPLQSRIEMVTDDADLEEVYETERHLLYVACTRARDFLLLTSGETASEFLDDLRG